MDYDQFIEDMLIKAEELKLQGDFEKAVEILQKIIMDEPDCVEAYEEVGDCYLSLRKKDKAEKHAEVRSSYYYPAYFVEYMQTNEITGYCVPN